MQGRFIPPNSISIWDTLNEVQLDTEFSALTAVRSQAKRVAALLRIEAMVSARSPAQIAHMEQQRGLR